MTELSDSGKSGSILYRTKDDNFICKTASSKEATFLQNLLPGYWINLVQNPKTYLPKFFGLYCYSRKTRNIRMVVMNNLLPSNIRIHHKFDLKGSTKDRRLSERQKEKHCPVYKDLDFLEMYPEGIQVDCEIYDELTEIVERDCRVLESYGIMDYSLLLGIHNQSLAAKEGSSSDNQSWTSPMPFPPPIVSGSTATDSIPHRFLTRSVSLNNTRLPFRAKNHLGENLLIYFGIIDILQHFDLSKRAEKFVKSFVYDGKTVSVQPPGRYSERFQNFIRDAVFKRKHTSNLSQNLLNCCKNRNSKNIDPAL